jgi:ubiquinol-cytochrome c reductase cytochrome b subunit
MSYWGAQVIISLFGAVPVVGEALSQLIRGDFVVSDATLNRFFALHVIAMPLVLLGLVMAHLMALHEVGSNNPDGIEIHDNEDENGIPLDGIAMHPYYTIKDIFGVVIFLAVAAVIIFFAPEFGGYFLEHANFQPADSLQTPVHIAPVWYFTPFYAILRASPDKLGGVIGMGGAVMILALLPWLDRSKVRSIRYKGPVYKFALTLFVISFLGLGYLGMNPPSPTYTLIARVLSVIYFLFFLAMPIYSRLDSTKPVPDRLT